MYRDLTMKEISEQQIGQTLQVAGWVENIRDHGGAAHAHAFHDGRGRAFTPRRQHQRVAGLHIGAHVAGLAQVFDAAFVLPAAHLGQIHAAQALFRRAQQLEAGGGTAFSVPWPRRRIRAGPWPPADGPPAGR